MSLNKRTYTNQQTVITAENLNEIQDAIIDLQEHSGEGGTWGSITGDIADQTDLNTILTAQSSQIETLDEEKADATDLTAEVTRATEAENTLGAQIASLNALGFSVINGEINITFEEEET